MAYWWVSQNRTYRHERNGGYLWAPKLNKAGRSEHHWQAITFVRPGDVIFCYVQQQIRAVALAKTIAFDAPRPAEFNAEEAWESIGWRVDANYRELEEPLSIPVVADQLVPLLPAERSPLTRNKTGVQGYLFHLPPAAGSFLLRRLDETLPELDGVGAVDHEISSAIASLDIPETEKQAIIQSRVGQGRFRESLLNYWSSKCAVTGVDVPSLLRASHIKPWRDSDNSERLDPFNGLLLAPSHDAAFDSGLIAFADNGTMLASTAISVDLLKRIGVDPSASLRQSDPQHLPYLKYHRENVFKSNQGRQA